MLGVQALPDLYYSGTVWTENVERGCENENNVLK